MTGSPSQTRHRNPGLLLIAAYKLVVALFLAAVGVGALHLIGKDVNDILANLITDLRVNPESRFVNFVLEKAPLVNDPLLRRIGLAAFCYAGLGILEAIGLYLDKIWGEYLTLLITASFLPFELHELLHRITWLRVSFLVINCVVFVYLLLVVIDRQRRKP